MACSTSVLPTIVVATWVPWENTPSGEIRSAGSRWSTGTYFSKSSENA